MTTLHHLADQGHNLYELTGDIKDINTLLVPRNELRQAITLEPQARTIPESSDKPEAWQLRFLTDVTTAAGLLSHGKQSKALAERIGAGAMRWRLGLFGHTPEDKAPEVGVPATP